MIRSILRLPVTIDQEAEFEQAFARLEVFAKAAQVASMRTAELLRPMAVPTEMRSSELSVYVVTATWTGPDDYRRWLESPVRAAPSEHLSRYVAPNGAGGLYAVVERF